MPRWTDFIEVVKAEFGIRAKKLVEITLDRT
jgi:hypothetical protein